AEIIYGDHYGNAMTGLRAATLDGGRQIRVAGRVLPRARTFSDMPQGAAFWYENSIGLVEISINRGNAMAELGMEIGTVVEVGAW
ncbi:MAG TPA: SAM hydroxide adenosyltransferase, partial [Magnetospirillum sp.]|nr:SAM hydroxide adenosyltransferase [Magnetospirillum sp.]